MQQKSSSRRFKAALEMTATILISLAIFAMCLKGCQAEERIDAENRKAAATTTVAVMVTPELESTPTVEAAAEPEHPEEKQVEARAYFAVPMDAELQDFIIQTCEERHIDAAVIVAMIGVESKFNANAIGDNGKAFGLMQIHPEFHGKRMTSLDCPDLLDPLQNAAVGIDYLAELIDTGNGLIWALMAYNGGAAYANRMTASGVVSDYVKTIFENSEILTEGMICNVLQ